MIGKSFAVSCIAWVAAAIFSVTPAEATIAVKAESSSQPSSYVLISAYYQMKTTEILSEDGQVLYQFPYLQRMTVEGGRSMLVAVDFIYPTGRRELVLLDSVGGYFVYGAGSCAC